MLSFLRQLAERTESSNSSTLRNRFGLNGSFPDVIWDGFVNSANVDENGPLLPDYALCLDNGDSERLNVDLGNDSENIVIGGPAHACSHTRLPPVVLEPPLG